MANDFSRRDFLKKAGALGIGGGVASMFLNQCSSEPAQDVLTKPGERPNIIWISCEDISARIGCYGDKVARTPNIDKLAAEGLRYTNTFTSAGVCAPCRSGIITGMYQTSIGTMHMRTTHKKPAELPTPYSAVPPPYVKTFTEYLRADGYYCTNNSKTDYQYDAPLTAWDESSEQAHYRNRSDNSQPFFAIFNLTETHEKNNWNDPEITNPADVSVPPYYPDTETVRKGIAKVYDNIEKMDTRVGEILSDLGKDGLANDTIIFFWSDHGDALPRKKRWVYDSGTHVPMIVKWKDRIKAGSVSDELVSSIDFGPTVLSLANVSIPAHMQGMAFLGAQANETRKYAFSARDRIDESYDMVRSVRDEQYRYVRNYYPLTPYVQWVPYRNNSPMMKELLDLNAAGKLDEVQTQWLADKRAPEELYDCLADPHNVNNLADNPKYKKVLDRLSDRMDQWRVETRDMGDIAEDTMVASWLTDGKQRKTSPVKFIPNTDIDRYQKEAIDRYETSDQNAQLYLYCATQGASIAYRADKDKEGYWRLYTGALELKSGSTVIQAKAIRYGYLESDVVQCDFTISQR